MSEPIKRYYLYAGKLRDAEDAPAMSESVNGSYVLHTDLVRAEQANAELRADLARQTARVEKLEAVVRDLEWIEIACVGGGYNHNMTCQEALSVILEHARSARTALAAALSQPEAGT